MQCKSSREPSSFSWFFFHFSSSTHPHLGGRPRISMIGKLPASRYPLYLYGDTRCLLSWQPTVPSNQFEPLGQEISSHEALQIVLSGNNSPRLCSILFSDIKICVWYRNNWVPGPDSLFLPYAYPPSILPESYQMCSAVQIAASSHYRSKLCRGIEHEWSCFFYHKWFPIVSSNSSRDACFLCRTMYRFLL